MRPSTGSVLAIFLLGGALGLRPSAAQPGVGTEGTGALITPEAIQAHMTFLADDALEGRGSGSRGYDLAAKYARAYFQTLGLSGGAGDGGYFQQVPLRRGEAVPEGCSLVLEGPSGTKSLRFGEDYLFFDTQAGVHREVSAPVVFAGFGVSAPEQGYDDYANLDVRGKVVAVLYNGPGVLPDTIRAYYADDMTKMQNAAAHGAKAMMVFLSPEDEKRFTWEAMLRETRIGFGSKRWVDSAGRLSGLIEEIQVLPWLSRSGAEALFAGEQHSLKEVFAAARQSRPASFALSKRATIRRKSRHTPLTSPNVIATLEGSDPKLRDEYVVYSAHLDHLGVGPAVNGDDIYNGALDNAAGSAVVLEIARAFSSLSPSPRRSVAFLLVTAEESGLVGSDYFAQNPTIPIDRIVADINLDGGVSLYPAADIIAWGEEHSDLKGPLRKAATEVGFEVSPDPFPEETFFIRSDQYSFVRQGVPSLFLDLGLKSLDPRLDGGAILRDWLVTAYHSPKDDMSQAFHFASSARLARVAFLLGREVAMQDQRPRWNSGDFFGKKFGRPPG